MVMQGSTSTEKSLANNYGGMLIEPGIVGTLHSSKISSTSGRHGMINPTL
jgi:hypothetical protein